MTASDMGTRLSEETLVLDETNDSRNDVELRLNVFPPKSGLPSCDPTSLAVLVSYFSLQDHPFILLQIAVMVIFDGIVLNFK